MTKKLLSHIEATNRYRKLIDNAGGTYSTLEVAEFLNITQRDVNKYKGRGSILGITLSNRVRYPVWQFKSGNILPRFAEILGLLQTKSEAAKVRFFLSRHESLPDTVIMALQSGEYFELIKRKALNFGVHGANWVD